MLARESQAESRSQPRNYSTSPSIQPMRPSGMFSKYLMNDILRGTRTRDLMNSLLVPPHPGSQAHPPPDGLGPQVLCGVVMADSRLDDELSVATIEFAATPNWLRDLNGDPHGFPKKTTFGTLWNMRGVSTNALDSHGQTEFIRAVIKGNDDRNWNLYYAEMLAEFEDTDVNIQDEQGRTALHWACELNHVDMVRLCLSVPDCETGLKDHDGLTAFDISARRGNDEIVPNLFYKNIFEEQDPQTALLRVLTISSEPAKDKSIFPGEAIFDPLHSRNSPLVTALINRGIDLTAKNKEGDTALHVAAMQVGNAEIVTRLLEAGSGVNAIGKGGATPLHHAVGITDIKMVQALLDWKADTTVKDSDEKSALHWAALGGQQDVAQLLLDHGACVGEKDKGGRTALQLAEENVNYFATDLVAVLRAATDMDGQRAPDRSAADGREVKNEEVVRTTIGEIELRNENGLTELLLAEENVNFATDLVQVLRVANNMDGQRVPDRSAASKREVKNRGVARTTHVEIESRNKDGLTALLQAVLNGDLEAVRILLDLGADKEAKDQEEKTALQLASESGHQKVVEILVAAGANIEAVGGYSNRTALQIASQNGHQELVEILVAAGANLEAVGPHWNLTALHLASQNGHEEVVEILMAAGANIEAVGGYSNRTALQIASQYGHQEVVEILVAAGANIEAVGGDGNRTALQLASRYGHQKVVEILVAAGANIEAVGGYSNQTALQIASQNGHEEVVEILVAAGVNIEAVGGYGNQTALQIASQFGHQKVVEILVAAGANIEAVDPYGNQTALQIASQFGHQKVVEILAAAGANIEAVGGDGNLTALQIASQYGHQELVEILMAARASAGAQDGGKIALQLASDSPHVEEVHKTLATDDRTAASRLRNAMRRRLGLEKAPRKPQHP